jgi:hypothetical protein
MSINHTPKVARAAAPHLGPGEVVQIGALPAVGSVSLQRKIATAAIVGIATGGMLFATSRPARRFLAVTNHRLLFFDGETISGRPGKLITTLPRQAVQVTWVGPDGYSHVIELAIAGQEKGLKLVFPMSARTTMQQVTAVLTAPGQAGPPPGPPGPPQWQPGPPPGQAGYPQWQPGPPPGQAGYPQGQPGPPPGQPWQPQRTW